MPCQLRVGRHHRRVVGCGARNWSDIPTHWSRPPHSGLRIARGAFCQYMWYIGHVRRASVVARNLFEPILDVAHIQAKTATKGRLNNNKSSGKGKVRLECAADAQFMRTRLWEALVTVCLEEGGMNNKRVGGRLWADVGTEWWDNFAKTCVYPWQTGWLSGGGVARLHKCSIRMGKAHFVLQWPKLLWSHVWIDHINFFARKCRILSKISCFPMEGGHRRVKRMLRNSAGLSLLRGLLGVQVVVNSHTTYDSLRGEGWDVAKRSMCGQGIVIVRHLARLACKRALSDHGEGRKKITPAGEISTQ